MHAQCVCNALQPKLPSGVSRTHRRAHGADDRNPWHAKPGPLQLACQKRQVKVGMVRNDDHAIKTVRQLGCNLCERRCVIDIAPGNAMQRCGAGVNTGSWVDKCVPLINQSSLSVEAGNSYFDDAVAGSWCQTCRLDVEHGK